MLYQRVWKTKLSVTKSSDRSQTRIHGTVTIRLRCNTLSRMSDYELNTTEEYVLLLLQVIIYVQNLAEISGSPA